MYGKSDFVSAHPAPKAQPWPPPLRAAIDAALRQEEVEGGGDGGDLRAVAGVGVRLWRVGVHLRRRRERRVGHPGAEAEAARRRDADHALLEHRLADDCAVGVGGRDVRHPPHGVDDSGVPVEPRVGHVGDQVEPVWNGTGLKCDAVARRLCRPELGLVGVGRLVQVDVAQESAVPSSERLEVREKSSRLLRGRLGVEGPAGHDLALRVEAAVRVDRLRVPALDRLVAPRAHARDDEQVEALAVRGGRALEEEQCALHARRLVAVHSAACTPPVMSTLGRLASQRRLRTE
eukprot:CAMPEP_0185288988 /NCGR_PEP_ID=MMETSP1363-20130426/3682_1 /TAXON_ID=38817 /ORGANISM="Gephyrocapsa oceanica, Strain RCC1303" /LENGTH=289 /DNA_ID=CAMNT_0027884869 /DNA_START=231 /DNA_END=1101 /DNA_ORIENTATION=-